MSENVKHHESDVKVYSSLVYSDFVKMAGNRMINPKKIDKIIESINGGLDILKYAPIIVNKDMVILDGQHRCKVAIKLGRPVYYIVVDEKMGIKDVASINSNTEKWKMVDFLNSYCKLEIKDYEDVRDFIAEYPFTIGVGVLLMAKGKFNQGGDSCMDDFKSGTFKVNHYEDAYDVGEHCRKFEDVVTSPYSRGFASAVQTLMKRKAVDWKRLVDKVESQYAPHQFKPETNPKRNLELLESAYNHGKSNREQIY